MFRLLTSLCAAVALAFTFAPEPASAQSSDTLTISGAFRIDGISGSVGDDLADVSVYEDGRWWTLTAYGVTYSHDAQFYEWYDYYGYYHYQQQTITRVHATSFDLEFFGPDADTLNAVVSAQLTGGSYADGAILELANVFAYSGGAYYYYYYPGYYTYGTWTIGLQPDNPATGIRFAAGNWYDYQFPTDADGYPVLDSRRTWAGSVEVTDNRSTSPGYLVSYGDVVEFGSAEPPLPPTLKILDGSVLEGKKGAVRLDLTVTLSRSSSEAVTVHYATADGTARSKKDQDYTAASGTLTIPSGQTQGIVSVSIKGDRKREPNETFTVSLSSAVGAAIGDGSATVTILNDD